MARKPMVTRTIKTTAVTVLCLNVQTGEPYNDTVVLPRTFEDDTKIIKTLEKCYNTDERKAVHVVAKEERETLYGMLETDFIKHAEVLPPRGTTEAEENATDENIESPAEVEN